MSIIEKAASKLEQRATVIASPEATVTADLTREPPAVPPEGAQAPLLPSGNPFPEVSAEQKTAETGTALFAKIDLERLRHLNIFTPVGEYSLTAEEFRMIKRPLLNNAFSGEKKLKNSNLIMVTSALPGDGKSFCALNLAISIAMEMDRTVLLVDADVSKPGQLKLLGIQAELGLLDLIQNPELPLSEVLIKTSIANLTLLPAGKPTRNATELLASEAMARLLDDLAGRYPDRLILFDSPPLLVTTESSVLSTHMGQVVMMVDAASTTQPALKSALTLIQHCGYVGLIINRASPHLSLGTYGYGYSYGYGYGQQA